jgi:hypothetical protein
MTTIVITSQDSLNTRGIKRKRASGIKFNTSNVSKDAISAENRDEGYFLGITSTEGAVSEQSDTYMDDSPVSPKKRLRVQEPPVPSTPSSRSAKKKYNCTFEGCQKAYTKPTRLEEHKRSHTGEVRTQSFIKHFD